MTGLLNDDELAGCQATQDSNLPDVATLSLYSSTRDGIGGDTDAYTPQSTKVACRLGRPTGTEETNMAERLGQTQPVAIATFSNTVDLKRLDRFTVASQAGVTYQVLAPVNVPSYNTANRYWVAEVLGQL